MNTQLIWFQHLFIFPCTVRWQWRKRSRPSWRGHLFASQSLSNKYLQDSAHNRLVTMGATCSPKPLITSFGPGGFWEIESSVTSSRVAGSLLRRTVWYPDNHVCHLLINVWIERHEGNSYSLITNAWSWTFRTFCLLLMQIPVLIHLHHSVNLLVHHFQENYSLRF